MISSIQCSFSSRRNSFSSLMREFCARLLRAGCEDFIATMSLVYHRIAVVVPKELFQALEWAVCMRTLAFDRMADILSDIRKEQTNFLQNKTCKRSVVLMKKLWSILWLLFMMTINGLNNLNHFSEKIIKTNVTTFFVHGKNLKFDIQDSWNSPVYFNWKQRQPYLFNWHRIDSQSSPVY